MRCLLPSPGVNNLSPISHLSALKSRAQQSGPSRPIPQLQNDEFVQQLLTSCRPPIDHHLELGAEASSLTFVLSFLWLLHLQADVVLAELITDFPGLHRDLKLALLSELFTSMHALRSERTWEWLQQTVSEQDKVGLTTIASSRGLCVCMVANRHRSPGHSVHAGLYVCYSAHSAQPRMKLQINFHTVMCQGT